MGVKEERVAKVTDAGGRVFYTRELDRSRLMVLPGVRRVEDVVMTTEEYEALPATEEAKDFFAGIEDVRGRAE